MPMSDQNSPRQTNRRRKIEAYEYLIKDQEFQNEVLKEMEILRKRSERSATPTTGDCDNGRTMASNCSGKSVEMSLKKTQSIHEYQAQQRMFRREKAKEYGKQLLEQMKRKSPKRKPVENHHTMAPFPPYDSKSNEGYRHSSRLTVPEPLSGTKNIIKSKNVADKDNRIGISSSVFDNKIFGQENVTTMPICTEASSKSSPNAYFKNQFIVTSAETKKVTKNDGSINSPPQLKLPASATRHLSPASYRDQLLKQIQDDKERQRTEKDEDKQMVRNAQDMATIIKQEKFSTKKGKLKQEPFQQTSITNDNSWKVGERPENDTKKTSTGQDHSLPQHSRLQYSHSEYKSLLDAQVAENQRRKMAIQKKEISSTCASLPICLPHVEETLKRKQCDENRLKQRMQTEQNKKKQHQNRTLINGPSIGESNSASSYRSASTHDLSHQNTCAFTSKSKLFYSPSEYKALLDAQIEEKQRIHATERRKSCNDLHRSLNLMNYASKVERDRKRKQVEDYAAELRSQMECNKKAREYKKTEATSINEVDPFHSHCNDSLDRFQCRKMSTCAHTLSKDEYKSLLDAQIAEKNMKSEIENTEREMYNMPETVQQHNTHANSYYRARYSQAEYKSLLDEQVAEKQRRNKFEDHQVCDGKAERIVVGAEIVKEPTRVNSEACMASHLMKKASDDCKNFDSQLHILETSPETCSSSVERSDDTVCSTHHTLEHSDKDGKILLSDGRSVPIAWHAGIDGDDNEHLQESRYVAQVTPALKNKPVTQIPSESLFQRIALPEEKSCCSYSKTRNEADTAREKIDSAKAFSSTQTTECTDRCSYLETKEPLKTDRVGEQASVHMSNLQSSCHLQNAPYDFCLGSFDNTDKQEDNVIKLKESVESSDEKSEETGDCLALDCESTLFYI